MVILFSTLFIFYYIEKQDFFLYTFEKQEIYFHYIQRMPYDNLTYLYVLRIDFFLYACVRMCVSKKL